MTNLLSSVGAALKAAAGVQRLPFSRHYGGASNYLPYGLTNLIHNTPSNLSWEELAGDPLSNSIVARCVECIANALPDAPPYLEHKEKGKGLWVRVDEHPVLDLLRTPNPFHSDAELWGLVVAGERTRGRAFWYLAWDDTRPREIWPLQSERVTVLGSEEEFISGYRVQTESGRVLEVGEEQVIHFRHLVNPWNPREGWTPLETGKRQLAGDNAAASYHTSILRNSGVLSLLIAVKDGSGAGQNVTPDQMEHFVRTLQRKLFGEGAGGIAGLNLPLDVHRMSYSPDEMALDRLISYYETRLCILLGVDPMVAGVGSGTQQRTYANFQEALNDFWERTIVPMHNRHAAVLTAQLLPLFGLEPCEWRLKFDYSGVAALQENKDGLHARIREDFRAGVIDLYTAQVERGLHEVPERFKGKFYGDEPKDGEFDEPSPEVKYNPLQPRDRIGRWTTGMFLAPFESGGGSFSGSKRPLSANYLASTVTPGPGRDTLIQSIEHLKTRTQEVYPETGYAVELDSGEILEYAVAPDEAKDELRFVTSGDWDTHKRISVAHSHRYESAPSGIDWSAFLLTPNMESAYVVTPGFIYTLERPHGPMKYAPEKAESIFYGHKMLIQQKMGLRNVADEDLPPGKLQEIWDEVNRKLAEDYSVNLTKTPR